MFRALIPLKEQRFIQEVDMNIIWFENTPVFHMTDKHRKGQNAADVR